jgi:hypothetical protein
MSSSADSRFQHSKAPGDVYLLCDLTEVIEFFRKTLRSERLLEMPEVVAYGTTPVLVGVTCGVDLKSKD